MAKQDFYELLGVSKGAGAEDLKRAYRKLAMQWHPDRNPGDKAAEQKFKDINEAYDVLKDDQKRAAYDRFGHAAFENGRGAGPGDFGFASGFADIFDEMFGDFMGGRRGQQSATRGNDLRYNMEITLEEAFKGKQASVRVPTLIACESCTGTGAEAGSKPVSCPTCHGHGRVRAQQGFFTIERTCPSCHGGGRVIENPCRVCSGQGRVRREKTLAVSIPAGVEDGNRIRLSGEGEAGVRGGASGDLYIFLSVRPHRFFQRDGANIQCRVPIEMATAALGGTIEVPAIDGTRAKLTIPAGTQTGRQFRIKGKGMSVLRSPSRGDMYIEATVETPVNLTKRQQELLREFAEAGDGKRATSPEAEGFFSRVKEFFEDLRE
ncbi:MAG TPA: molecular chaperone DnaJ [Stellaceae bacterium]|jgi:molecular chaperone DnaJ|nr:molecular chaperone DnaJ [Stellaceae bacterium]